MVACARDRGVASRAGGTLSLNPPMSPMEPLVWPGRRPISAAEAVHLLGAPPFEYQRAPDLGGRRRAHGVSVDSGLGSGLDPVTSVIPIQVRGEGQSRHLRPVAAA